MRRTAISVIGKWNTFITATSVHQHGRIASYVWSFIRFANNKNKRLLGKNMELTSIETTSLLKPYSFDTNNPENMETDCVMHAHNYHTPNMMFYEDRLGTFASWPK